MQIKTQKTNLPDTGVIIFKEEEKECDKEIDL